MEQEDRLYRITIDVTGSEEYAESVKRQCEKATGEVADLVEVD